MKRIIILLSMFFWAASAFAEYPFLKACLIYAETHNKKLALAKEQLGLSSLRITRSGRAFLPSVIIQRKSERGTTIADQYESEEIGVRASQPIYDGGRLTATYKYDKLYYESAQLNLTKTREELYYRVRTAYYDFLNSRAELKRIKSTSEEITKLYEKSKKEFEVKAISELDLAEAKSFSDKIDNMYKTSVMNEALAQKKLTNTLEIRKIDEIIAVMEDPLVVFPDNISFTLDECRRFVMRNNLDVRISKTFIAMSELKKQIIRARILPKFYAEGFYAQSGEAFVTEPLKLATVWNVTGRIVWGLWGNTLEASQTQEKAVPSLSTDISTRIDSQSREVKLSLFDDLSYFVESKENEISAIQSSLDFREAMDKSLYELEKYYNDYQQSLAASLIGRDDIVLKTRKLDVLRKKNEFYEVSTLEVMDGVYKYADAVISYTKALSSNYLAVCELEKLTMIPLR